LELALPEAPEPATREDSPGRALPEPPPSPTDLSRLSFRARALIAHGNAGAGNPCRSRSEADFAVCLAMFGAGYEEAEVRAVMTDPANGISERTLEKGRHAEGYLALTIGKARSKVARARRFAY
jgi:RepB DNA-primase C-terminal helical domain